MLHALGPVQSKRRPNRGLLSALRAHCLSVLFVPVPPALSTVPKMPARQGIGVLRGALRDECPALNDFDRAIGLSRALAGLPRLPVVGRRCSLANDRKPSRPAGAGCSLEKTGNVASHCRSVSSLLKKRESVAGAPQRALDDRDGHLSDNRREGGGHRRVTGR